MRSWNGKVFIKFMVQSQPLEGIPVALAGRRQLGLSVAVRDTPTPAGRVGGIVGWLKVNSLLVLLKVALLTWEAWLSSGVEWGCILGQGRVLHVSHQFRSFLHIWSGGTRMILTVHWSSVFSGVGFSGRKPSGNGMAAMIRVIMDGSVPHFLICLTSTVHLLCSRLCLQYFKNSHFEFS